MKILPIAIAALALAACTQQDTNAATADANAGAAADDVAHNSPAAAAPLGKAEALALMKQRHENYEEIGDAMKLAGRELKSSAPDLAKIRKSADFIAEQAPKAASWFPAGTGPDVGKTEAKAEIWQKPEDFKAKHAAFVKAAQGFQTAARGTDLAAIRAAQGDLGKTCKSCHELYRKEHR